MLRYKNYKMHFKGMSGMSNIVLGYYSCAYLSLVMKRLYKISSLYLLDNYFNIPKLFIENNTLLNYKYINDISINLYCSFSNHLDVAVTTCHDILESTVNLCRAGVAKCYIINIFNNNYIHEIYKLRKKLLQELLYPKSILINVYKNFKKNNPGFIIGVHIRTSILSDFHEKSKRFYDNITELLYHKAIKYVSNKYRNKKIKIYIISDSSLIKNKFMKIYKNNTYENILYKRTKISHNINDISIKEQYILSKCDVIIGSCASTYTLLSVFRYLHEYYAIAGLQYSNRGFIKGMCGYSLDYNHQLFSKSDIFS